MTHARSDVIANWLVLSTETELREHMKVLVRLINTHQPVCFSVIGDRVLRPVTNGAYSIDR